MQTTLVENSTIGLPKHTRLETERQKWWDTYWYAYSKQIIKEINEGKKFDTNEIDGLHREFELGALGAEELGITEEEFEKLSFEQFCKKAMQANINFFEEEMGINPAPEELDFDVIENNLNRIEKELEEIKNKKRGEKHERKSSNLFKV